MWGDRDRLTGPLRPPIRCSGPRLRACAQALVDVSGKTAEQILGPVDAMKPRSSMTLFHRVDPAEPVFAAVLARYYDGVADEATGRRR
jgi:uncharacterized protein (DUF1810 family)